MENMMIGISLRQALMQLDEARKAIIRSTHPADTRVALVNEVAQISAQLRILLVDNENIDAKGQ